MSAPIVIQAELDLSRMASDIKESTRFVSDLAPNKISKVMASAADVFVKKIEAAKLGGDKGGGLFGRILSGSVSYINNLGKARLAWQSVYKAQIAGGASVEEATKQANIWQAEAVASLAGGFARLTSGAKALTAQLGGGAGIAGAVGVAAVAVGGLYFSFQGAKSVATSMVSVVGGIGSAFSSLTSVIGSIGSAIGSAFSFVWSIGAEIVSSIGGALTYVGGLIGDTFSSAFGYVKDIVSGVFSWMKNTVFSAVGAWLGTVSLSVGVLAVAGARLSKTGGQSAQSDDDTSKDFGFLQNVIEKSGEAITRFIDKIQVLVGGWFAGVGDLVSVAAEYLTAAIDWIIPKLQSVIVTVLTGVLKVISTADSIVGAVSALFSGDFAAAGAMIISASVKVVEGIQGIIKMLAPQINWIASKITMLAGGVLSLVASGFAHIESPLKTSLGFIMTIGAKILNFTLDFIAVAMEYYESGSSASLNSARSAQHAMALSGQKLTTSAGRGDWAKSLEDTAKNLSDSGAAGIDAAGAMSGVLGDLSGWLKGVSSDLDPDAEAKFGGLLDPAKEAIEMLLKTLGGGKIEGVDKDKDKNKGASAVDSIDSVLGSIKVGEDKAAELQKRTLTEQRKTNGLLTQIAGGAGALT